MHTKKITQRKKRVQKKKVPNNKQLATRIRKLEHQDELKYHDSWSQPAAYTGGYTLVLNNLTKGDDVHQRIGDQVSSKFLNMRVRVDKSAVINPLTVRLMILWDLQTNATGMIPFASTDLNNGLIDDTTILGVAFAPLNYRTKHRYHVLYDKVHVINPDDPTCLKSKWIKKNINLSNAIVKFGTNTGTGVGDMVSRSLLFFAYNAAGAAVESTSNSFRYWYVDP